jgi:hypothetical protein
MVVSGEKLGTDMRITQLGCGYVGSPSSQKQWICSNLLATVRKVAICEPHEIRMVLSMESVWHVGRVFPCKVYIDLNRRDSRI